MIKRNRGNSGLGVWRVELLANPANRPMVRVLDATQDAAEDIALAEFFDRCVGYFDDGCVIDQPFQARLNEGVVRCYMAGERCAGFGYQKVRALVDAPAARAAAGPRLYASNADDRFQRLRRLMEDRWTPQLASLLDIPQRDLPMIWDADFMLGPRAPTGPTPMCSVRSTSVRSSRSPTTRPAEIARRVADRLRSNRRPAWHLAFYMIYAWRAFRRRMSSAASASSHSRKMVILGSVEVAFGQTIQ